MIQKPKTHAACAAACTGINALECWDSPDLMAVLNSASQFVSCESACEADPSFAVDVDMSCFAARPATCKEVAECLDLRASK